MPVMRCTGAQRGVWTVRPPGRRRIPITLGMVCSLGVLDASFLSIASSTSKPSPGPSGTGE